MRTVSVSVGLIVASIAGTAFADPPQTPPVQVESITYNGSGCDEHDDVSVDIAADGTGFTLGFTDFFAQVGPGIPSRERYAFCQAALHVTAAPGYTYAIAGVEYGGYVDLAPGTRASIRTLVYPQGRL